MSQPLDLDLLRTFVAIVESGSFSHAAPLVGRTQSAVSMQMQRLEHSIGREILVRGPQAAKPNAAGRELLVYARKLLRLSAEARAAMMRPEEAGVVRLGVPEDYVGRFLPPILARFATEHPLVSVELICEASRQLIPAIDHGRIDLAIVTCLPSHGITPLRREHLAWVAGRNHVVWTVEPLPVALFDAECGPAHSHVIEALEVAKRAYRVAYSSASLAGLISVVEAGLAVAALPRCSAPAFLRIVGESEGLPFLQDLGMSVLHSPASTSAAVQQLKVHLKSELTKPMQL